MQDEILRTGFLSGARSECWAVAVDHTEKEPNGSTLKIMKVLTCGTLIEGVYDAVGMEPGNPQVLATLSTGIAVRIFSPRTPRDVCIYLKNVGNRFNGWAAKPTFLELYSEVLDIEKSWKLEAKQKDITARDGCKNTKRTYEAAYRDFIMVAYPGRFESFREYEAAKTFRIRMQEQGLWDRYADWTRCHTEFANPEIDTKKVVAINGIINKSLLGKDVNGSFVLQLLKFTVPNDCGIQWANWAGSRATIFLPQLSVHIPKQPRHYKFIDVAIRRMSFSLANCGMSQQWFEFNQFL
jgi:hypothetical protein